MSLFSGCQDGKGTPRLVEVCCPNCGKTVEVFIRMGGDVGQTGTLAADEKCGCGYVLQAGTYEENYTLAEE